ncbi:MULTISPECIES: hypothetical protein [Actinomadura]|uniref:Uncharacterized protein n=1 Tax=Actinomadura geliboluensis TaxID=882440 RepID=A0A5S4GLJ2_9ACTN|nr:hypothetical protein [Actinomadura geliboluensis]TMR33757.1 hypothetical protein ETD96_26745 [Actinomadura geliboluensis]
MAARPPATRAAPSSSAAPDRRGALYAPAAYSANATGRTVSPLGFTSAVAAATCTAARTASSTPNAVSGRCRRSARQPSATAP